MIYSAFLFFFSAASNGDHLTSNRAIFGVSPSRLRMSQFGIKATSHNNLVEEREIHGKSQRRGNLKNISFSSRFCAVLCGLTFGMMNF